MNAIHYYVGVDGGGTKCSVHVYDDQGELLASAKGGPANIAQQPLQAQSSILEACSAAFKQAGIATDRFAKTTVCAGLAGANVAAAKATLQQWAHPFAHVQVISDLHAAVYGAHAGQPGAVMIIGTGSCAAGWSGHQLKQWGGHGFLLGDKGSGAWLGLRAVQHTLEVLDGVQPTSLLAQRVQQQLQLMSSHEIVTVLHQATAAQFAALAPLVIELAVAADPVAQELVTRAASYLDAIGQQARAYAGGRLVLVGGLAELLSERLSAGLQQQLGVAQHGPEWGAIAWFHRGLLCPAD